METKPIKDYEGDIFIGIDAGSTTLKLVCIDKSKNIIYSKYTSNEGNPVLNIKKILEEFYKEKILRQRLDLLLLQDMVNFLLRKHLILILAK